MPARSVSGKPPDFVPQAVRNFRGLAVGNHYSRARLVWAVGCFVAPAEVKTQEVKTQTEVRVMLGWVVTFLIVALVAGVLGFGGVAGASIEIAKIIFFIAVILFVVSAVVGVARGRRI
jgi:uncharacterized membrane protein YtjA (UPF0391 family)